MATGGTNTAGTTDTRVDRPEEGLPGLANIANPTASPISRATFDAGKSVELRRPKPKANIDTSGTSGLVTADDVKRGEPAAW